jgi:hypothetical protein
MEAAPAPTVLTTPSIVVSAEDEGCDYCGVTALAWRKCKLICTACHQINRSCADL